jgi:hypothetical protein
MRLFEHPDFEDEGPFPMRLLHFRRTFVEKMFTIHGKVEAYKTGGTPIGPYARHYYDLYFLADRPEVIAMLSSSEYGTIKQDYDRVSRQFFAKSYFPPEGMTFARSDALFPPPQIRDVLAADLDRQCRMLCFGPVPTWDEIQRRLEAIRTLL